MSDQMAHIFGSDSEEDGQAAPQQEAEEAGDGDQPGEAQPEDPAKDAMRDVFGSEDEDEAEEGGPSAREPDSQEQGGYVEAEGEDRQRQLERPRGPPMRLEVPLHNLLGSESIRLVKLSNILGIEPRAFDGSTFEAESSEYTDELGRKRIRLKDQNTIRWRWAPGPDGKPVRQSNARFVRWSDGSLQLFLGDEVLDAREIDISGDHNYAFVRHQQLVQGQGQLTKKMVFQPASLTSASHKRLAAYVDRQNMRQSKVRSTTTLKDPKKLKEERAKVEEAVIRDREKLADRQAKQMRKYSVPRQSQRMTTAFLEEEEDVFEDEGGADEMAEAQRARMLQQRRGYDEAEEAAAEQRLTSAKAGPPMAAGGSGTKRGRTIEESDEEISGEEGGEENKGFIDDEDEGREGQPAKKRRGAVVFDSDED